MTRHKNSMSRSERHAVQGGERARRRRELERQARKAEKAARRAALRSVEVAPPGAAKQRAETPREAAIPGQRASHRLKSSARAEPVNG
jgi:hypothetical protein